MPLTSLERVHHLDSVNFWRRGSRIGLVVSGAIDGGFFGGGNSDDLRGRDFPHQGVELGQFFGGFGVAVVNNQNVTGLEWCRCGDGRNDQGEKKEESHYLRRLRLRRSYASETFGGREAETSSRSISWEMWVK